MIERVPIGEIWLTPQTLYDPSFQRIRRLAASRRIGVRLVGQGDQTSLGDWSVRVLWPPRRLGRVGRNEGGVVLRIDGPRGCVLLPGDAPIAVEDRLAPSIGPCPVLKLGHHGSETSTGPGWLTALEPHLALVSASPSLHARFPGARLRKRLRAAGVTLYETSRWGAIRVGLGLPSPVVAPYRTEPLPLKPLLLADR